MFWLIPVVVGGVVALLSSCKGEDEEIPPLDDPNPDDTKIPDNPRNNFDECFPPNESLSIVVEGTGAFYGSEPPVDGCFVMAVERESISVSESGFTGIARWASYPPELSTKNPGDPGYGLMAERTFLRESGAPLTDLGLGFVWPIEGTVDLTDCRLEATFRTTVMTPDGFALPGLDYMVLPFYSMRADGGGPCLPEADFSNEVVVIHDGPVSATLVSGEPGLICSGDCIDVNGEPNPATLEMTLLNGPF